ncbi:MAG: LytR C-terminal domain-containing protein [Blautia sp.]|nr:LytR C-terminal domain-containing protein [Blautia sp.]
MLRDIAFIAAILILVAALGLIYYVSRKQDQAESERLETIIANEQSPQINNAKIMGEQIEAVESDGEKENGEEKSPEKSEEDDTVTDETASEAEDGSVPEEAAPESGAGSEGKAEKENETKEGDSAEPDASAEDGADPAAAEELPEPSPELLASSIVILNGTSRNGMAALWLDKFTQAGYTSVSAGSYRGAAEPLSVVYTKDPEQAKAIGRVVPGIIIREGDIPGPFVMSGGVDAPSEIDHYVIIGNNNVQ